MVIGLGTAAPATVAMPVRTGQCGGRSAFVETKRRNAAKRFWDAW